VGILILNRNGKHWLELIYESIRVQTYPNIFIYLVDNGSEDGSIEFTLKSYPEVKVIKMPQNLGYCMAYNLAMPHAFADGCDWVIWANNDVRIEPNCLNELVRISQSDPKIGILGPSFLAWDKDEPNYYMLGNHPYAIDAMKSNSPDPIEVEWVEGSFLMVSRRCLEAVGPLDPYLNFYWEEADFCRRARHRGWRVVLMPRARGRHFGGGSLNEGNSSGINCLRERNYYIYKLANPFQSFSRSLFDAIHLFLVNVKRYFPAQMALVRGHIRTFWEVIRDIRVIHQKWACDRKGIHPPTTTEAFKSTQVELIRRRLDSSTAQNIQCVHQ
jgi:GT2 family glycosyltransferase